jgi:hypothetical protein
LQIKAKTVSCHTADFKPAKQEVKGTLILPPLAFPGEYLSRYCVVASAQVTKIFFATTVNPFKSFYSRNLFSAKQL